MRDRYGVVGDGETEYSSYTGTCLRGVRARDATNGRHASRNRRLGA